MTLWVAMFTFGVAQTSCNSNRYADTVFHSVNQITNVKFGTATPYGLLAQPQDLFLDIYEPAGDTLSKRPIIVFQFGGGFGFECGQKTPRVNHIEAVRQRNGASGQIDRRAYRGCASYHSASLLALLAQPFQQRVAAERHAGYKNRPGTRGAKAA